MHFVAECLVEPVLWPGLRFDSCGALQLELTAMATTGFATAASAPLVLSARTVFSADGEVRRRCVTERSKVCVCVCVCVLDS